MCHVSERREQKHARGFDRFETLCRLASKVDARDQVEIIKGRLDKWNAGTHPEPVKVCVATSMRNHCFIAAPRLRHTLWQVRQLRIAFAAIPNVYLL
jgi:hypothetical protein